MHIKRKNISKFWSVPRKGTKYLALPNHNKNEGISLVVIMRDILKLVENKKELKKLLNERKVQINHINVRELNHPVCVFDIISFPDSKISYKAILSKHKKMIFEEVSGKEAEIKIYKILNKKILPGNKIQINLMQGKNMILKEKVKVGDSLAFNLKENKVEKIIPAEKGREAFILNGKHIGHSGKIDEIINRGGKMLAKMNSDKGRINVWMKNIIIIK